MKGDIRRLFICLLTILSFFVPPCSSHSGILSILSLLDSLSFLGCWMFFFLVLLSSVKGFWLGTLAYYLMDLLPPSSSLELFSGGRSLPVDSSFLCNKFICLRCVVIYGNENHWLQVEHSNQTAGTASSCDHGLCGDLVWATRRALIGRPSSVNYYFSSLLCVCLLGFCWGERAAGVQEPGEAFVVLLVSELEFCWTPSSF